MNKNICFFIFLISGFSLCLAMERVRFKQLSYFDRLPYEDKIKDVEQDLENVGYKIIAKREKVGFHENTFTVERESGIIIKNKSAGDLLCTVAFAGHTSIAEKLLKLSINVDSRSESSGRTPLMDVVMTYHSLPMVKLLLSWDADPLAQDEKHSTPRMLAHRWLTEISALETSEEFQSRVKQHQLVIQTLELAENKKRMQQRTVATNK